MVDGQPADATIVPTRRLYDLPALLTDLFIALRNVLRHRRRSLMGIASIAFGVIALMQAAGFVERVYWAMREDTIRSRLGHIQIMREGYLQRGQADPYAYLLPGDSPIPGEIAQLPGVRAVAPRLAFSGLASLGETTLSFIGEGMEPASEAWLNEGTVITAGRELTAADAQAMVLGHGLAQNRGARVDDTFGLLAIPAAGGINAVEGAVRGTFSTVSESYDEAAL